MKDRDLREYVLSNLPSNRRQFCQFVQTSMVQNCRTMVFKKNMLMTMMDVVMALMLLIRLPTSLMTTATTKTAATATAFATHRHRIFGSSMTGGGCRRRGRCISLAAASQQQQQTPFLPNFCSECGSNQMIIRIPDGDERPRAVCDNCTTVVYSNPKVVVSCVILKTKSSTSKSSRASVLLAKRNIEPRKGYWGIPQGYMEHGETTREACVREVYEETGVTIDPKMLKFRGLLNVPGSVQIVYESRILHDDDDTTSSTAELPIASTTMESSEIQFFDVAVADDADDANDANDNDNVLKLPVELCFPTVEWAIRHCLTGHEHHILQKNKLYDPISNTWGESEDF